MAERKLVVKIVGDASSVQRSFNTASRSTRQFSRDLSHAERGVLSGSGVFKSLGRSLAFASGGFLAFGSAAAFLRKSIDAAKEAQVVQQQLATQLRNNGKSFADYRSEIDKTTLRLSALSGFQDDELQASLTTILRTVPNVSKALRDLSTSADLARARHIDLGQAALIIAKTEAGNTTLLRRQGFQIEKNTTSEKALATLRRVVAGQARAGTTEQERFGAVLHDTEEIIGRGILPTLNRYLISGTKWLQQMNESGQLQKDVAQGAHDFESAIHDVGVVIHDVDRVTGSFKNTLELLLALKVAGFASRLAGGVGGLVGSFGKARLGASALGGELAVGNASLAAQAGVASFAITTLGLKATGLDKDLRVGGAAVEKFFEKIHAFGVTDPLARFKGTNQAGDKAGQIGGVNVNKVIAAARSLRDAGQSADETLTSLEKRFVSLSEGDLRILLRIAQKMQDTYRAAGGAASEAGAKAAHGLALAQQAAQSTAPETPGTAKRSGVTLTASQRNTFFDNALSRILKRGGLQDLQGQLSAITKAEGLLKARLAKTKDVTRRLNLEDQILELAGQAKDIRGQIVADRLSKRQQAFSDVISALQLGVTKAQATSGFSDDLAALEKLQAGLRAEIKSLGTSVDLQGQLFNVTQQINQARKDQAQARISALATKQFKQLGLTGTGDEITPGVKNLQKRLRQLTDNITGTSLDTPKLRSELARFRKVLSEGLVPKDVRAKIREMMDAIAGELKNRSGPLTKAAGLDSKKILEGLGLSPDQIRELRSRLSGVNSAGQTIAGKPTGASRDGGFVGGRPIIVESHTTIQVDGATLTKVVTRAQQKARRRNPPQRRGPNRGG